MDTIVIVAITQKILGFEIKELKYDSTIFTISALIVIAISLKNKSYTLLLYTLCLVL